MSESKTREAHRGPPNPELANQLSALAMKAAKGDLGACALIAIEHDGRSTSVIHDGQRHRLTVIGGLTAMGVALSNALTAGGIQAQGDAPSNGEAPANG